MSADNKPFRTIEPSRQALEPGTILDGRYEIVRVIGEGGFGITYEAVNQHTGQQTAIKEHKEGNSDKILREARVLRDFAAEPAIVTVFDSFLENGKAYMVMEYLEGVTLAEEIKRNGKWTSEKTVQAFIPVMHALERMHKAGVIHRDISPDNLMVKPDGALVLMDFGAAKEVSTNNYTQTSIYKSVYSPPEQRDIGMTLGSYTDVYALCAAIYYCITGNEPEDSLSRLLFDELKNPSEAGADILPRAEKALLKGLELKCEDRIQEVNLLREELEAVYPDLTEEERIAAEKRKQQRRILIRALCGAVLLCILILLYTFRIQIRFAGMETQEVMLDGSSLTAEEFQAQAAGVKARVKAFAGRDNYLWNENDGKQILLEVPSGLFGKNNPQDFIRIFLTRPMVLSISLPEQDLDLGVFSPAEDILSVDDSENGLLVTFSQDAAKRFGGALNEKGTNIRFTFDQDAGFQLIVFFVGSSTGDGCTVDLTLSPEEKLVAKMPLTHEPLKNFFRVQSEWKVRWEDPKETIFPGKNQFRPEEIPGKTVSVRYTLSSAYEKENHEGFDSKALGFMAIFKNRLDSLGVPYAIGINIYDEDCYVVKVPNYPICMEELIDMGIEYSKLTLGSQYAYNYLASIKDSFSVEMHEDGTYALLMHPAVSEWMHEDVEQILKTIQEQGGEKIYLYYQMEKIASCPLNEALSSFAENESIPFSQWEFGSRPEMDISTLHLARFMEAKSDQSPEYSYNMNEDHFEVRDEKGKIIYFDYSNLLPEHAFINDNKKKIVENMQLSQGEHIQISLADSISGAKLLVFELPYSDLNNPETSLAPFVEFFKEHESELTSGDFQSIQVVFYPGASLNTKEDFVRIYFKMDFNTGTLRLESFSGELWLIEADKKFSSYILNSPWWEPLLPEDMKSTAKNPG